MGCMQSADFAAQPPTSNGNKAQQKSRKAGGAAARKKKVNRAVQQADTVEEAVATQVEEAAEQRVVVTPASPQQVASTRGGEQAQNPFTPPKPMSPPGDTKEESVRRPTNGGLGGGGPLTSGPRAASVVGVGQGAGGVVGGPGVEASQLGSRRGPSARPHRSNEGGLNAAKVGTIRTWIDHGDQEDLVDPQDVFGHERKMRRKLLGVGDMGGGMGLSTMQGSTSRF